MAQPQLPAGFPFIRVGDSLINLNWVRAIEHSGDGRLNVYLSEDRATGLVLRFSGHEAREAWAALCAAGSLPVIDAGQFRTPEEPL
jgi:hypothetical protein